TPTAQSQANISAQMSGATASNGPPVGSFSGPISTPKQTRSVTRNKAPVKSSQLMIKRTRKPTQKRTKKPVTVSGYHWRKNGAGWDLRKSVYVTSNNGEKTRKQPYVAHMSREAFGELKRQHKGAKLEKAIGQWIQEHDK